MRRINPFDVLKNVAIFALFGPGVFVLYRGFKFVARRRPDLIGSRDLQERRTSLPWTFSDGWNVRAIPKDMVIDLSDVMKDDVRFDAAGIKGLVRGEAGLLRPTEFSFLAPDKESAMRALRGNADGGGERIEVRETDDGKWKISSRSITAVNEAAKAVFPSREVEVRRDLRTVRQYRVDGCRSYAEALERVKAEGAAMVPVNTFIESVDTVDGRRNVVSNGSLLSASDLGGVLPAGTFIVTGEEVSSYASRISVPMNAGADVIDSVVADKFIPGQRNAVPGTGGVSYSDGVPEGIRRVFRRDDGTEVSVAGWRDVSGVRACVMCTSFEQACALADGGALPAGTEVLVGRDVPVLPSGGTWPVSVDLDSSVIDRLGIVGGASLSESARLESVGLSGDAVAFGAVADAVGGGGVLKVSLSDELNASKGMRVGGVRVSELVDRKTSSLLPSLDPEGLRRWAEDAGHIQSVTFTLNPKDGMLRITSVVDGMESTDVRPVTPAEAEVFRSYGQLSEAECKDLLMQCHPDYFRSYSVAGKAMYRDPIGAFLSGEKAREAESVDRKKEKAIKAAMDMNRKQSFKPHLS